MSKPSIRKMRRTCPGSNSEAHHDCDVAGLLHHHHGEGDEDIESSDDDDESDDNKSDDLLEHERAKEFPVLFHPVGSS